MQSLTRYPTYGNIATVMQEPTTEIVHGYTPDEINAIIQEAVLAERERCARIVNRWRHCVQSEYALEVVRDIEAQIRSGK